MVDQPEDWPWSSYRAMIGEVRVPSWLDVDWLLGQFASQRKQAIQAYRRFVVGKGFPAMGSGSASIIAGGCCLCGAIQTRKRFRSTPEGLESPEAVHGLVAQ
jgi:hypothetical protein